MGPIGPLGGIETVGLVVGSATGLGEGDGAPGDGEGGAAVGDGDARTGDGDGDAPGSRLGGGSGAVGDGYEAGGRIG